MRLTPELRAAIGAVSFEDILVEGIVGRRPSHAAAAISHRVAPCPCNGTVLLDLLPPATLYGDRIYQVDIRFNKTIHLGRTAVRPIVSVYNLLNANPVLSYNNRYGPAWMAPLAILTARFADVGVQVDF